jgi:hypothetical protein
MTFYMGPGYAGDYTITINFPDSDIVSCQLPVSIIPPDVPPKIKVTNINEATMLQEEQVS